MTTKQDLFMERMKEIDSKIRAYARFFAFKAQNILEADDLVQTAYLSLFERFTKEPEFIGQNNSYISCYAAWMMKNALNHESALYSRRVTDLNPEFSEVPYLQASLPRPEPEAVRSEVRDIASQLPEEYQAVYTRLVEGYDLEEIGDVLGISKFKASRVKQEMIHAISLAYQLPRDRRQLMIRELYR